MKCKLFIALTALSLLLGTMRADAAETIPAETNAAITQIRSVATRVQSKLNDGLGKEKDLTDELKAFDDLATTYKTSDPEAASRALFTKSMVYLQVIGDVDKGTALIKQIQTDFPDTPLGKKAGDLLANIEEQKQAEKTRLERQQQTEKMQTTLVEGAKFPDFDEKDLNGKPLSIANYKGKVVLIDFWATWCGPCLAELPNIIKAYETHHPKGFEIISISLDQDRAKLETLIKENKMTWQHFFDGKGWGNKLGVAYGVNSIPATYLLDGEGKIIAKGLRGEDLEAAVAKALPKK